jgi:hypothetical protein
MAGLLSSSTHPTHPPTFGDLRKISKKTSEIPTASDLVLAAFLKIQKNYVVHHRWMHHRKFSMAHASVVHHTNVTFCGAWVYAPQNSHLCSVDSKMEGAPQNFKTMRHR